MRAFLSYSSGDGDFVEKAYQILGDTAAELDTKSFETGRLSIEAVLEALKRCSIFVLFLSRKTAGSAFVTEELLQALNSKAAGSLRRILIFSIDDTSHTQLPAIAKNLVVNQRVVSPKICARRIQSYAFEIESTTSTRLIFVGREQHLASVKSELAKPGEQAPRMLAMVGQDGIGRRTFAEKAIADVLPTLRPPFPAIAVRADDGPDDVFRMLYQIAAQPTVKEFVEEIQKFSHLDMSTKRSRIADVVRSIRSQGEVVFFVDEGGVLDFDGKVQDFIPISPVELAGDKCPYGVLVINRMPPPQAQRAAPFVFFERLEAFSAEEMQQLASYHLKALGIGFSGDQLRQVVQNLDGHPINLHYAVAFIKQYGIAAFLADTSEFVLFKQRRAKQYLKKITFSNIDKQLIGILSEYSYLTLELIIELFAKHPTTDVLASVKQMEDISLLERRGDVYVISSPLRVGVERDQQFELSQDDRLAFGASVLKWIDEFQDGDELQQSIIEAGLRATIQNKDMEKPEWLSKLILPSHLTRLARDAYDKRRHRDASEMCERALQLESLMTQDGRTNLYRLYALCLARLRRFDECDAVREKLRGFSGRLAKQNYHFLGGFVARLRNDLETAKVEFLKAYEYGPRNFSISRELAQVYLRFGDFASAESYARAAFAVAPTNPYIIDMLIEVLIGKSRKSGFCDQTELYELLEALRRYGDDDDMSFYLSRMADIARSKGDLPQALSYSNDAVAKTPNIFSVYKERAKIFITLRRFDDAKSDLAVMRRMANDWSTGEGKGALTEIDVLEFELLLGSKSLRAARQLVDRAGAMPKSMKTNLAKELALAVSEDASADTDMRTWARGILTA